ncbi:hypothetical protein [Paraflavitalea speifideaquila]|uniref:hypothetical protein n=1 Tax=Paraflavitalea speifideaquila TaxID=3076558 RepID=UPI0028EE7C51|nr:hypothetical protein [Paraflavitalea speifideiaquila]
MSGIIGDLLLFRQRAGKTFAGKIPVNEAEPTASQLAIREKFKAASRYAQQAIAYPAIKQAYLEKATPGQTAFNVAFADYFKKPEILSTDTSGYSGIPGSVIRMQVADNFKIKRVTVLIVTAAGATLEQGEAVPEAGVQPGCILRNNLKCPGRHQGCCNGYRPARQ